MKRKRVKQGFAVLLSSLLMIQSMTPQVLGQEVLIESISEEAFSAAEIQEVREAEITIENIEVLPDDCVPVMEEEREQQTDALFLGETEAESEEHESDSDSAEEAESGKETEYEAVILPDTENMPSPESERNTESESEAETEGAAETDEEAEIENEADAEMESESNVEVEAASFFYEEVFEEAGITVTLCAEEGIVPTDAEPVIRLLGTGDLASIEAQIDAKTEELMARRRAEEAADPRSVFQKYHSLSLTPEYSVGMEIEIYYTDEAGNLCEFDPPQGQSIQVTIKATGIGAVMQDEMREVNLFHIPDQMVRSRCATELEILTDHMTVSEDAVSFAAEHFSVYTLSVMRYRALSSPDLSAAQELAWGMINTYADPEFYLDDPYKAQMTDEQYAELQQYAKRLTAGCSTQYEKIRCITADVSNRIYYDYKYLADKVNHPTYFHPYDIHVNSRTVCSGYARYMRTLLTAVGIPCMNIHGENHEFNGVYDSDSDRWFLVDATWCSRNQYTPDGQWIYRGYDFDCFDLPPEAIAALTSHEVYDVYGLLEPQGSVFYQLTTDQSSWSNTNLWYLNVYTTKHGAKNIVTVDQLWGIPVIGMGNDAFYNNTAVETIDLSLTPLLDIPDRIFAECFALTSVTFPAAVKRIGTAAFHSCTALKEVDLSGTAVTLIDQHAFRQCTSLEQVKVPQSLKEIGYAAFYDDSALKSLDLSETVTEELGEFAFGNCTLLERVRLPKTLQMIGNSAFQNCASLKSINLQDTKISTVYQHMMRGCVQLTSLKFPETLTQIERGAFKGFTKLKKADLSAAQVTKIDEYVFADCTSLETVKFPKTLETIENAAFQYDGRLKTVDLSATKVKRIGSWGFYLCEGIKEVRFPTSLVEIGYAAFCRANLRIIDLSGTRIQSLGEFAFSRCNKVSRISLPKTLTKIENYAFNCEQECKTLVVTPLSKADIRYTDTDRGKVWSNRDVTCVPSYYTVHFEGNGASSGSMSTMTCGYSVKYKLKSNRFQRSGYTFTGWNTKKDGSGTRYKNKDTITKLTKKNGRKVILYAQWKATSYSIAYKLNRGTNAKGNPSSYKKTTPSFKLKSPTRKGYTFKGWYKDSKYKTKVTKISKGSTGSLTLYAKWSAVSYPIRYVLNGGTNAKGNRSSYKITTASFQLKSPTRRGYTFKGWYKDAKYRKKVTKISKGSTGAIRLYAKWEKKHE